MGLTVVENVALVCTLSSSSIAVSGDAPSPPTSGVSAWGSAVVFGSAYSLADSFVLLGDLSNIVSSALIL